jgi:hypothetical protein
MSLQKQSLSSKLKVNGRCNGPAVVQPQRGAHQVAQLVSEHGMQPREPAFHPAPAGHSVVRAR